MAAYYCEICNSKLDESYASYPNAVCGDCGKKAANAEGKKPVFISREDTGDNPVFIDGKMLAKMPLWGIYNHAG